MDGVHVLDGNRFDQWKHTYDKGYRLLDHRETIRELLLRHTKWSSRPVARLAEQLQYACRIVAGVVGF